MSWVAKCKWWHNQQRETNICLNTEKQWNWKQKSVIYTESFMVMTMFRNDTTYMIWDSNPSTRQVAASLFFPSKLIKLGKLILINLLFY